VNHPRHDLLPGAGRAEDELEISDGGGRSTEDNQHLLVTPDHFAEALD
jgi:hypothetical protein